MSTKRKGFGSTPGGKKPSPKAMDSFVNGEASPEPEDIDTRDTSSTRLSIDLQRWIRNELKIAAVRKGVTMTALVRELIYEALEVEPVDTSSED